LILTTIRGLGEVNNNIIGEEQAGDKGQGKGENVTIKARLDYRAESEE
jgi:hypothetical protein